ncbi:hypothetical protein [Chlamydiifrater phoenicopteri]|uniref:hypothetical protein n=1 Tax=Chlamydiifrater phoenicopteri TaxID=2681469 RepID=UPI001BCAA34E|nr:hypothetical protein [Chlamydiifrater phoenicopteri]
MAISKYKNQDFSLSEGKEDDFRKVVERPEHKLTTASRVQKLFVIAIIFCSLLLLSSVVLLGVINVVPLSVALELPFLEFIPLVAIAGVSLVSLMIFSLCHCCLSRRAREVVVKEQGKEEEPLVSDISLKPLKREDELQVLLRDQEKDGEVERLVEGYLEGFMDLQEELTAPITEEIVHPELAMALVAEEGDVAPVDEGLVNVFPNLMEVPEAVVDEELLEVDPAPGGMSPEEEISSETVVLEVLQGVIDSALQEVERRELAAIEHQTTALVEEEMEEAKEQAKSVLEALKEAVESVRRQMGLMVRGSAQALGGLFLSDETLDEIASQEVQEFLKEIEVGEEREGLKRSVEKELHNIRRALKIALETVGRRAAKILEARKEIQREDRKAEDVSTESSEGVSTEVQGPKTVMEALKEAWNTVRGKFSGALESGSSWDFWRVPFFMGAEQPEVAMKDLFDGEQEGVSEKEETPAAASLGVREALREAMSTVARRASEVLEARFGRRGEEEEVLEAPMPGEEEEGMFFFGDLYEIYKTAEYKISSLFEEVDASTPAVVARSASGNVFRWLLYVHLEARSTALRSISNIELRCGREWICILLGFVSIKELEEIVEIYNQERSLVRVEGSEFCNSLYAKCIKKCPKLITAEAAYFSWIKDAFPYLAKDESAVFRLKSLYRFSLFNKIRVFVDLISENEPEEMPLLEKMSGWQVAGLSKLYLDIRSLSLISKYKNQLSDWDHFCRHISEYCRHTVFRKKAYGSLSGFLNFVQKGMNSDIFKEEEFAFATNEEPTSFFDSPRPLWDMGTLYEEDPELRDSIEEGLALLSNYGYLGETSIEELQEFERVILGLKKP